MFTRFIYKFMLVSVGATVSGILALLFALGYLIVR